MNKSFEFRVSSFGLKTLNRAAAKLRCANSQLATRNSKPIRAGFTLVEMITVIAITAIIAAAVGVFLRVPVQGYQDSERRAAITDAADTAFKQISRDLHTSLPNSVRVTGAGLVVYLEFLQTRSGGRYRSEAPGVAVPSAPPATCPDTDGDTFANDNVMRFGVADTCFGAFGVPVGDLGTIVPGSDFVVIYNLGPNYANADAYATGPATGGNKSLITAPVNPGLGSESVFLFQANNFLLDSPGRRFHVISGPVSYVCDPPPGAGTLTRISGYAIAAVQPTPPAGATALLARNITACTITYDQNVINQRVGVVSIWLSFADPAGGTAVNLFQQVQVSNVP